MRNHPKKGLLRLKLAAPFVMAMLFMVVFAGIGSHFLFRGHAASVPTEYQLYMDRGLCMDNYGSSTASQNPIDIWACNGTGAQQWTAESVTNGFLLVNGQGTCADDTGDGVGTSSSNRVYLQTYPCNASDHAQVWKFNGAQIQNAYNNGCINDPAGSETNGQQLIIYPCSPAASNNQWYAVAVAPPVPSVSITAPASGATVSGSSVLVSAKASVSSGSITNITLKVGGATLYSCSNAGTCFRGWDTTGYANGTYTVQAIATGSGGGTATASESVKVSNAAPSPPPSSGGGGGSGGGTGTGSGGGSGSGSGGGSSSGGGSGSGSGSGSSGGSGGSSVSVDSGGGGDTLTVGSDPTDISGTDSSGLSVDQAPSDTLNTPGGISTPSGPTVYDIVSTNITSSSITMSWQTAGATSFTVKFGTNQTNLTNTVTVKSKSAQPSITLSKLSPSTQIYVSVTPHNGKKSGATISTSFTTLKGSAHSGGGSSAIIWIIFLLLVIVGIFFLRRKLNSRLNGPSSISAPAPTVQIEHLPVYPREDSAQQAARLNWWMPEDQRQAAAQHPATPHNAADDIPDMYSEGNKRLQDEERDHRIPGS